MTMRIPESLVSLTDEGIIREVVRPLMSGKEAQVYLVSCAGELRVAKIYKEAQQRTFRQRAQYTDGRRVRNSRDQRAIDKGSRHGREQDEAAWRSAEVDTLYRLEAAGVRVPKPFHFVDGVLIMELIADADGNPAPRLGDVQLDRVEANAIFHQLLGQVVRMLCAGVVHGDLSDFNVLLGARGPVIIDFPQAVSAASNQNARNLLLRDVANLQRLLAPFARSQHALPYAQEMWQLYQRGELTPETKLLGRFQRAEQRVDTASVLASIGEARRDAHRGRGGRPPQRGHHRAGPIVEVRRSPGVPTPGARPTADSQKAPVARPQRHAPGPQGHASQAHSPHGHSAHGHSAHGHSAHGHSAHGHSAHGHSAHGHSAQGHSAHGHSARNGHGPHAPDSAHGATLAGGNGAQAGDPARKKRRRRKRRGGAHRGSAETPGRAAPSLGHEPSAQGSTLPPDRGRTSQS